MFECLLLGAALIVSAGQGQQLEPDDTGAAGQPTTATPPPAGAIERAVPATPDRWLLVKELQGTWPGDVLDGERLSISGWVEGSFTAGTVGHNQLPLSFNYRADEPILQQAWLRFERSVVTTGTSDPTFGFRSDWSFGTDYRFTLPRGIFNGQLTAHAGEPDLYGVDPVQMYGEAYFPTIGQGLDVKVGRFFAPFGVENIEAVSNALLSHSYTFTNGPPFTNTGALATLTLTPVWQVQCGVVLGSDIFLNPAAQATAVASVQWTQPGGRNVVKLTTILDSGRYNQADQQNNFNELDLVYQHVLAQGPINNATSPILTYNLEILGGYETHIPDQVEPNGQNFHIGTDAILGVANYLNWTVGPRLTATVRLEFFEDIRGTRMESVDGPTAEEAQGLYTEITFGLTFKPIKDVMIQPEVRYDYNGESRPFAGNHGLLTAGLGMILRF